MEFGFDVMNLRNGVLRRVQGADAEKSQMFKIAAFGTKVIVKDERAGRGTFAPSG